MTSTDRRLAAGGAGGAGGEFSPAPAPPQAPPANIEGGPLRDPRTGRLTSPFSYADDVALRAAFLAGETDEAIAELLGKTVQAVKSRRVSLRLSRHEHPRILQEPPGWQHGEGGGVLYWTDERVAEALRAYAGSNPGPLPRGTHQWDEITRGRPDLPVSVRILQQYGALGVAWRVVLGDREALRRLDIAWVRWTLEEDAFIEAQWERLPLTEIAARLGRTPSSTRQHAKRALGLGSQSVTREWWSIREVADHYGVSTTHVRTLITEGLLPAQKVGGRVRIDPRHLPGVESESDPRDELTRRLTRPTRGAGRRVLPLRRHRGPGYTDVITRAGRRAS